MLFFKSKTSDPKINLATEEYLFKTTKDDIFMIWQNDRSIILGQYQNAYEEINMEQLERDHIHVVRRITGGGAVYHDLGNVNFSFINLVNRNNKFDFDAFMKKIVNAINFLGAYAEIKGRNDIVIDGMKVSGNAQHVSGNRVLHHGTLLFDSDLSMLSRVLKDEDKDIESSASKSNRQRVTNIKKYLKQNMSVEQFQSKICTYILKGKNIEILELDAVAKAAIKNLVINKYDRWDWNIGLSPQCKILRRTRWKHGYMHIYVNVEHGVISEFNIKGDFFADNRFQESLNLFIGHKMEETALKIPAEKCAASIYGLTGATLLDWLINGE